MCILISLAINVPIIGQIDAHQQYCDLFSCFLAYSIAKTANVTSLCTYTTLCVDFVDFVDKDDCSYLLIVYIEKEKFLFSE